MGRFIRSFYLSSLPEVSLHGGLGCRLSHLPGSCRVTQITHSGAWWWFFVLTTAVAFSHTPYLGHISKGSARGPWLTWLVP